MAAAKPVTLTVVDPGDYEGPAPKPLAVVGSIPVAADDVVALTAVPASFADLAAVQTYLATLVGEIKSSDSFS